MRKYISLVDDIKEISQQLSDTELDRINLEEFLINLLIKSQKQSLADKKAAFDRKVVLNDLQNKAMGQMLSSSNKKVKKYVKVI